MVGWRMMLACVLLAFSTSACIAQSVVPEATPLAASLAASQEAGEVLGGEIVIFAAASLTDAFGEIGSNFEAHVPGATVVFNFAGSQRLAQQLAQGAPADLFASANGQQMAVAIEAGRILSRTQQTFAYNRLVMIYPADSPTGMETLQDLAMPGIKLVLAAVEVPVGAYSLDFLDKAAATEAYGSRYRELVLANIVSYEENVRSVLSKVILGEADAGIVYTSDVFGDSAAQVGQIEIPDALNTVASYPIAIVADSDNPALAQAFLDYLLSDAGQATLAAYGFVPAP